MSLYYPFELIKVRFMTKNDYYKYFSVSDAFIKVIQYSKLSNIAHSLIIIIDRENRIF